MPIVSLIPKAAKIAGTAMGITAAAELAGSLTKSPETAVDYLPEYKRKLDIALGNIAGLQETFLHTNKIAITQQNKLAEDKYGKTKNVKDLVDYYNKLDYLFHKTGVSLEPQEIKRTNIDQYVNAAQEYGISPTFAKGFWRYKTNPKKMSRKDYDRLGRLFDVAWDEREKTTEFWSKAGEIGGLISLGGHLGGMALPPLQAVGFIGDAIWGLAAMRDVGRYSQIDRRKAFTSLIYTAGAASFMLAPLKHIQKATPATIKFLTSQFKDVTGSIHANAANTWGIEMNKLTSETNRAVETFVNPAKALYATFGDYSRVIGDFNGLRVGQIAEREKANVLSSAFSMVDKKGDSLSKIVFNPKRYKDVLLRAERGEKLTDIEEMGHAYADFSFKGKLANNIHEVEHRVHGRTAGDIKAKFYVKKWNEAGSEAEVVHESALDFRRLLGDGEAFHNFSDAAKRDLLHHGDFGVLEMEVPLKGMKEAAAGEKTAGEAARTVKFTTTIEYGYTPLLEKGIVAAIERNGVQRLKFVPQHRLKDSIDELKSWGYAINKVYPANSAIKTNVEQVLKTVLDLSPEKLAEIVGEGEEGLKRYLTQAINDARAIKGLDVTKIKEFKEEHIRRITDPKKGEKLSKAEQQEITDVMNSLLTRSVSRVMLSPYNSKLLQLREYLNQLVTPDKTNTLASYMKNSLDSVYDPNFYKKLGINEIMRSSWVAYNVPIVLANHAQSVFVGFSKAAQKFGIKGAKDWLAAYSSALAGKGGAYGKMAKNVKTFAATASSKKNGFDMLRGMFYQTEPLGAIEEATVKNFLTKNPQYTQAFGFNTSNMELAARAGRDVLQFMSVLETPFAELKDKRAVDLAFSFYRYVVRPVTTIARGLTSKKGIIPTVAGLTAWTTLFGKNATPLNITAPILSLLSTNLGGAVEQEGLDNSIIQYIDGYRKGLIPDEMIPTHMLAFGDFFANEIVKGKGVVGKVLREQFGLTPSITTLGFTFDVPHASPIVEVVKNFVQQANYVRNLKANVDNSPAGELQQNVAILSKALVDTVGFVKRVSERPMASGYGLEVPQTTGDIVQRFFFPQTKYPASTRQEVPISVKNVEQMSRMTADPEKATEYFMTAAARDPNTKSLFIVNSTQMLSGLNKRLKSISRESPLIASEKGQALAKTIGMVAAWRSALGDISGENAANVYIGILREHGVEDTRAYLSFYYDVLEKAQFYRNTMKRVESKVKK